MSRITSHIWRLTHLYKFKPKEGGLKTFFPNRFQAERYNRLYPKLLAKTGHREIELKSRKFGTTTGCCFFCLDSVAYHRYIEAVTIAHTQPKATEIFNNIPKFAWDRVDAGLKPREKYNTKTEIDLSQSMGSKYIISGDLKATTPDILHLTEVAYFENDEKIREAIAGLPPHGLCIAESTGHGVGNWFEQSFMEAWTALLAGRSYPWLAIFNPWFRDPYNRVPSIEGRQLRFESEARALQEKHGLDDEQIYWWDERKQEHRGLVYQFYPSEPEEAFIHSGRPVFDLQNLKLLRERFERLPIRSDNDVLLWEEPTDDFYGIGVDTAEGLAHGDNSVISVVRKGTGEEVCQVAGRIAPHELARLLGVVCRMFPNHSAIIERNNHGHTVIAYAKEDPAIRLYRTQEMDKITQKMSEKIGWDTNEKSKSYAIDTLSRDLEDQHCIPHSPETYEELRVFVHGERGKMAALPGKHDDRVMALSLASFASKEGGVGEILFL